MVQADRCGIGTSTGTGGVTAIPLIAKGRAEGETAAQDINYFFGIDSTAASSSPTSRKRSEGGTTPSLNHPITGTAVIDADSVWHHAAATYDGTNWNLYLDGVLDGTLSVGRPANARHERGHLGRLGAPHHRNRRRVLRRRDRRGPDLERGP